MGASLGSKSAVVAGAGIPTTTSSPPRRTSLNPASIAVTAPTVTKT